MVMALQEGKTSMDFEGSSRLEPKKEVVPATMENRGFFHSEPTR